MCNHLWCRSLELGKINPTPFVTFPTWLIFPEDGQSIPCMGWFGDLPFLWTRSRYIQLLLCIPVHRGNPSFGGSPPERIPLHQSGLKKTFTVLCWWHRVAVGKAFLSAAGCREQAGQWHAAVGDRSVWEEKQLSKTGHGHHSGGVSRSAGVEANLVCRHFY